ncbi:hypothetical protein GCM10009687_06430 [Asanoa iriomotensis]|uniref:Uncharacterized protein n=1 Tax=Asanoa iriomotensis TaxID=234613 RepID=A0ABQ4C1S5_9ACTN|nr:hypothetical protein Air01nite_27890 [Asanoa iriomotensis]
MAPTLDALRALAGALVLPGLPSMSSSVAVDGALADVLRGPYDTEARLRGRWLGAARPFGG